MCHQRFKPMVSCGTRDSGALIAMSTVFLCTLNPPCNLPPVFVLACTLFHLSCPGPGTVNMAAAVLNVDATACRVKHAKLKKKAAVCEVVEQQRKQILAANVVVVSMWSACASLEDVGCSDHVPLAISH